MNMIHRQDTRPLCERIRLKQEFLKMYDLMLNIIGFQNQLIKAGWRCRGGARNPACLGLFPRLCAFAVKTWFGLEPLAGTRLGGHLRGT
jgi:hypothetical protein